MNMVNFMGLRMKLTKEKDEYLRFLLVCESEINHTLATISSPLRNRIPLRRRHLQVKHLSLLSPTVLFVIVIGWFFSSLNTF